MDPDCGGRPDQSVNVEPGLLGFMTTPVWSWLLPPLRGLTAPAPFCNACEKGHYLGLSLRGAAFKILEMVDTSSDGGNRQLVGALEQRYQLADQYCTGPS